MYQLVSDNIDFLSLNRPRNISYHRIFDTVAETGALHFLHGVAITEFNGKLFSCFAFNDGAENTVTEQLMVTQSADDGFTWTKAQPLAQRGNYANSHSVFLNDGEKLFCFGPHFGGLGEKPKTSKGFPTIRFLDLQTEGWVYQKENDQWLPMGIVAQDFWPLGLPQKTADGNWFIPGCDGMWLAAGILSHGDDLTKWDTVKPDTDGEVFTEAAAWVRGNDVMMVMRNESLQDNGGAFPAAVSFSHDGGRTFGACEAGNLKIATTKPFCGTLSDGRDYMVFNESVPGTPKSRERMLIGIGHDFKLEQLYVLDEGYITPHGRRCALSYPYAKEINGKLYVVYSYASEPGKERNCNCNDAMLAVIPITDL